MANATDKTVSPPGYDVYMAHAKLAARAHKWSWTPFLEAEAREAMASGWGVDEWVLGHIDYLQRLDACLSSLPEYSETDADANPRTGV